MQEHAIVWFRNDLRIADNPALAAAAGSGLPLLPVYIHAPEEEGDWAPGAAARWWRHHALGSLDEALRALGQPLIIRRGGSLDELRELAGSHNVKEVYWNRRWEPAARSRDDAVQAGLEGDGLVTCQSNAALLWEPGAVCTGSEEPYQVFTPFWKAARKQSVGRPLAAPDALQAATKPPGSIDLADLDLLPSVGWDEEFPEHWQPTLEGARQALENFLDGPVSRYSKCRDIPGANGTSRLSPFLHAGQLGPRQVWQAAHQSGAADTDGGFKFLSEIAWREFAHHLLAHFPDTPTEPLRAKYRDFPWQPDTDLLRAWQRGCTGYPIVDAGMRQLWRTGWMHNRVRMVAASLLVKHLLQPWQDGARWFWDTLVDADLANNTLGWQWTAGCGADAAPWFRIFNPILQGEKFDPGGDYVRRWVPELAELPDRHLHAPWKAPASVLSEAGVELGATYPQPLIEHSRGRERALEALATLKRRANTDAD